jgi:hypothetical protein
MLVTDSASRVEVVVCKEPRRKDLGFGSGHGSPARIQPTLGKLVRIALAIEGREPTTAAIRDYQARELGHLGGTTVVAELMPLPSRNVSTWIYSQLGMPTLSSRHSYLREYRELRLNVLRDAIRSARPDAVIFLGLAELETWTRVAGEPMSRGAAGAFWTQSASTTFATVKHPTAFHSTNASFDEIGRTFAQMIRRRNQ